MRIVFLFNFLFCCHIFISQPLIIAHRGASSYTVENSLYAFEKAIQMGADYIETDVHQTSDSEVVIMHDLSVNRMCVVPKEISEKYRSKRILIKNISSSEFKNLIFKNSESRPPTLDSAIKFINGRCKLMIELKKGNDYYPGIEQHIIKIIHDNKAEEWVNIIHSFDKKALLDANKKNTGIKLQRLIVFKFPLTSFNFSKKFNKDKFENWQGVNVYYPFITKRLVKKLHKQNKTIFAWTVNKKRPMKRLIKIGVDGIITNKPDLARALQINKS